MKTSNLLVLPILIIFAIGFTLIAKDTSERMVLRENDTTFLKFDDSALDTIEFENSGEFHLKTDLSELYISLSDSASKLILPEGFRDYINVKLGDDSLSIMINQAALEENIKIDHHQLLLKLPPDFLKSLTALNGGRVSFSPGRADIFRPDQIYEVGGESFAINCQNCSYIFLASSAKDLFINTETQGDCYSGFVQRYSGYVQLKGEAKKVTASISGGAYFDAKSLLVDTAIVKTRNSGGAELYVMDYMDVDIDAANQVLYRGQPEIKKKERNFFGEINQLQFPQSPCKTAFGGISNRVAHISFIVVSHQIFFIPT